MVEAILVTHGDFGRELLDTAAGVSGNTDGCHPVSNTGKSPQTLIDEIDAIVKAGGDTHFLMFVDYFGGSTCHACLSVARRYPNVVLVSGVNLPMLLAFLYKRDEVPFEALAGELTRRGKDSIRVVDPDNL